MCSQRERIQRQLDYVVCCDGLRLLCLQRERIQRQLDYAKGVSEKNRQAQQHDSGKSRRHQRRGSYVDEDKETAMQRRRQAMNYAKSVPKPKLPPKTPQGENSSSKVSQQRHNAGSSATMASFETDLTKLQQRHENDRRQADMIRTTMQQKGVVMSPSHQTLSSEA
ncbi:hypothetical protein NP493_1051g00059 [Ridgeia piscesae]|uniref:Uncharacterized protein n=1 Tax=Ridgeia piscesae TaxID=27915 RepID=A0AAD9KIY1_RIDPI|nr:hypothetical protein NP493_1051g00059 [Ridgeia piscesae]